jgi:hypothetical protein
VQDVERPIILKPHEVRGILEGRQTQIRRLIRTPEPNTKVWWEEKYQCWVTDLPHKHGESTGLRYPFGKVGDRLWGRETWWHQDPNGVMYDTTKPLYYADGKIDFERGDKWCASNRMPRWASRITLEITDVRVERLQDISDADILANGIVEPRNEPGALKAAFHYFWARNFGKHDYAHNRWVWVIEFKRVDGE